MKAKEITKKVSEAMYLALNDIVVGSLSRNTPFKTGDTAANWEAFKTSNLNEFVIKNHRGDIVNYLEKGTRSHIIKPTNKKMLRFALRDKNGKPKMPEFKKSQDSIMFRKYGKIFFYNKAGVPVLGFVKEGGIVYVLARKVNHPGIQARFFVRDTLNNREMWKKFNTQVEERLAHE